jgi:GH25 family lysozyme M1 (1,4-beta-N-acetylmuramidase)
MRLRCKELVRKVSAFKDKIAVLLGERVLIYVSVVLEVQYCYTQGRIQYEI